MTLWADLKILPLDCDRAKAGRCSLTPYQTHAESARNYALETEI
jgi:hypothetical protein